MAAQKARLFCFKVKQSHIVQLFCTVMWKFSVENHLSKWGLGPRRGNRLFTVSNSVSSVVWLSTFSSRDNAQFIAHLAQSPKSLPRQTLLSWGRQHQPTDNAGHQTELGSHPPEWLCGLLCGTMGFYSTEFSFPEEASQGGGRRILVTSPQCLLHFPLSFPSIPSHDSLHCCWPLWA